MLGAGRDQVYGIQVAQGAGLRVLAVDRNPQAVGFGLADEYSVTSNRDVDALERLCKGSAQRGFPIAGILTIGADIPQVAAELAFRLGIPGPSMETGRLTTDKYLMKNRLADAGVAIPWFARVESASHLRRLTADHGGKLFVIKPTNQSGARGVLMIDVSRDDMDTRYAEAKSAANGGEIQIEEYISGIQISTESVLWEGKAYTPGFADRNYEMLERFYPNFIENGGVQPSLVQGVQRAAVEDLVQRAATALGIRNGIAKGDVVIAADGTPKIIEMAARLSGGDFSESLIPLSSGVNIVEAAIQIAVGLAPDLSLLVGRFERFVANRYLFGEPGLLVALEGQEEVRDLPWVRKFEIYVRPGDTIEKIDSHSKRLGVFVVEAKDRTKLTERIRHIYNTVRLEIR